MLFHIKFQKNKKKQKVLQEANDKFFCLCLILYRYVKCTHMKMYVYLGMSQKALKCSFEDLCFENTTRTTSIVVQLRIMQTEFTSPIS